MCCLAITVLAAGSHNAGSADSLKAIVAQQELQRIEQAYRLVGGHARTSTSYRVVSVRECQQCCALDAGTRSQSSSANADFGRAGKQHINQSTGFPLLCQSAALTSVYTIVWTGYRQNRFSKLNSSGGSCSSSASDLFDVGQGLGLPIAKQLANRLSGCIGLERSSEHEHTVLWLAVPVGVPHQPAPRNRTFTGTWSHMMIPSVCL
jgi:hypothetical protein